MSFPKYERYKDSGIEWLGDVPAHWDVQSLKRIAMLQSGNVISAESIQEKGEFEVYGGNGKRGFTDSFTHDGDFVLIGRQGALCGNINYVTGRFWASEHAVVAHPKQELPSRWLGELLRVMDLGQYSIASAQPGISVETISNLCIPVPPTCERKIIGAFLDQETAKIDALIEEQRRLIELLKEKRQAVISHAVSSQPRFSNGEQSSVEKLRRHLVKIEQGWSPQAEDRTPEKGEAAVLKLSAVKTGRFFPEEVKALPASIKSPTSLLLSDNDFLLTRANTPDLVGDSCVVSDAPPATIFSDLIYRLSLKSSLLPKYLNLVMQSPLGRSQAKRDARGSSLSMVKLGHEHIRSWSVPVPSVSEQERIIDEVEQQQQVFDELQQEAESGISLLQERRSALISAAVTGKIDVCNYTSAEACA